MLLYLISAGFVAIATIGVFFGTGFLLLAHHAEQLTADSGSRDHGTEIKSTRSGVFQHSRNDARQALVETELPRSVAAAALPIVPFAQGQAAYRALMPPVTVRVVARGPIKSKGPEAINRQLDSFKAAIERSGASVEEAFVPVLAPGWLDHFIFNEYYKTEEEFLFALADALREEYRAVVAAGFVLQIDDPGLPDWWDMLKPEPTVEAYRKFARLRIDAVNHALMDIPEEMVRYHLCWGSWHGPHTHDLPLEHIIDLILEVKAQTYSFEAANVRHEHEWRVW